MRFVTLVLAGLLAAGGNRADVPPRTFASAAHAAAETLEKRFYHAPGQWNLCLPGSCGHASHDWGADVLTSTLYLSWRVSGARAVVGRMKELTRSAPTYDRCERATCLQWSDVPLWDAVAAGRAYEITRDPIALVKARRAFELVDRSDAYALGACPSIDFQRPGGGTHALKTLETDSNYIKAALLLRRYTGDPAYLAKARAKYAAVRRYFLDPSVSLYSVYVFDNGAACTQLPKRFFASVNGNMIDNGLGLADATGDRAYLRQAIETAQAVTRYLGDASGVYANLQADNDVAEPLVEAMYDLATQEHQAFARSWLIAAAAVAQPADSGAYGRFFDGPAPDGSISAWSSSGGLALAIVAGALEPGGITIRPGIWAAKRFVTDPIASTPAAIAFTGRAIALVGTLGERCCEGGHVRLFIDGTETFNATGIWQNRSPARRSLPDTILFSWRWPRAGAHTIAFKAGIVNAKEGGSFIHLRGYELVP